MATIELKSVTLGAGGPKTAWSALNQNGFSDRDIASNKELLAFVALHSGVKDFTRIRAGATILVPLRSSLTQVVAEVRDHADRYVDAMRKVDGGLDTWKKQFAGDTMAKAANVALPLPSPVPPMSSAPAPATAGPLPAAATSDTANAGRTAPVRVGRLAVPADRYGDFRRRVFEGVGLGPLLPPNKTALKWDPPTTNTDGTPCTDLAGYKLYFGDQSRTYTTTIDVGNRTTFTIFDLPAGVHFFAVTAYNTAGAESDFSNEASKASR
ncbi:MAG: fibronectin type III domain-containing protein [Deltaproteobacteria bacterium]|nr:fibronectin type III domain-containing protein [Deltaproteobacteria bacterium]